MFTKLQMGLVLTLFLTAGAYAQEVKNVVAKVQDQAIVITYDFVNVPIAKDYTVLLYAIHDGTTSQLRNATGEVGGQIKPGSNKQIVWGPLSEFPNGFSASSLQFKVVAQEKYHNLRGLDVVDVVGGTFEMGCKLGRDVDSDQTCPSNVNLHEVILSDFQITKYEITNSQYTTFLNDINAKSDGIFEDSVFGTVKYIDVASNYSQVKYNGGKFEVVSDLHNYPVIEVSWYGAAAYARWAGGALPTEAQWEYAARGGNQSKDYRYSGSNDPDTVAWHASNGRTAGAATATVRTHPIGLKLPNELGIYDMSGNVWELCRDNYYSSYHSGLPKKDPYNFTSYSGIHIGRGGYWGSSNQHLTNVFRGSGVGGQVHGTGIGFRVAFP